MVDPCQLSVKLPSGFIEMGREVILAEAAALVSLGEQLNASFLDALGILIERLGEADMGSVPIQRGSAGRIIVTGVGKSGLVGQKIASTLASTGSPALFVHAGEAAHGDLGMIAAGDAVLALSRSGDTTELATIMNYCARFSIPIIAITAGHTSQLAIRAQVALILPDIPEAGGLGPGKGIAPTTSTIMTMALGDALAAALLRHRGFQADDFRLLHPGGTLGASLRRVSELMHIGDKIPVVWGNPPMHEALKEMAAKRLGCVGILQHDDTGGHKSPLIGIVTDGDLSRSISDDLLMRPVQDIMTHDPVVSGPDELAGKALARMNDRKITMIFVVDQGRCPLGIVHLHDFLRAGIY